MRPTSVVVLGPLRDGLTSVIEAEEQSFVQQFIPHPSVEALHEPILHGLAGRDVVPVDGMVLCPGEDRTGPLQSPNYSIVKTTTNEYLTDVYDRDLADAKARADKIVKDNAIGASNDGAACTAAE